MYRQAQLDGAHSHVDEVVDIADNQDIDPKRAALMIDARLKKAGKIAPRQYGDKLQLEAKVEARRLEEMSDDELAAIAAGRRS